MTSLWTVQEVAEYLKVKPAWIYERTAKGEIPCRKLGGLVRFDPAEIRAWADEHAKSPTRRRKAL